MKEITLKVYEFSELSKDVQNKLIQKRAELNQRHVDATFVTDALRDSLSGNGVNAKNVFWSLSNCQGDGVCVDGEIEALTLFKFMGVRKKCVMEMAARGQVKVIAEHRGRHCHKHSFHLEIVCDDQDQPQEVLDYLEKLTESALEHIRNACDAAEKVGYDHIDHLGSEEVAKDELLNDDQLYFADGRYFDESLAS